MQATHYKTESAQMLEVEIYETGEKTLIADSNYITNQKDRQNRSIIITAAQYECYKTNILDHDL